MRIWLPSTSASVMHTIRGIAASLRRNRPCPRQGRDHRFYFVIGQHAVGAAFSTFNLAAQGQYRLKPPVAAGLGQASGRSPSTRKIAFGRVALGAVGRPAELALSSMLLRRVSSRLAGGFPGPGCGHAFFQYKSRLRGVFFHKAGQSLADQPVHQRPHRACAQLGFCLPLELRLGNAHRYDGRQPFAHVLAGQVFLGLLEIIKPAGVVVDRPRDRAAEQPGGCLRGWRCCLHSRTHSL